MHGLASERVPRSPRSTPTPSFVLTANCPGSRRTRDPNPIISIWDGRHTDEGRGSSLGEKKQPHPPITATVLPASKIVAAGPIPPNSMGAIAEPAIMAVALKAKRKRKRPPNSV